ncbi:Sterol uptake control protein 2 [Colletotrichum higginsianum]|uniref:Sterol uptake control protein 2 n=1 Tax=Colletotrichum higginsianum TaxID=80884 RepID=A0A4T0VHK2_9PEZI|nr:Sterol uptake control protein 2 [Colletotrichum higginsianum]
MSPTPDKPNERRKHRKSRHGCLVCKRRRVKCDEARPRCGACVLGNRPCSYAAAQGPPPVVGCGNNSSYSTPATTSSSSITTAEIISSNVAADAAKDAQGPPETTIPIACIGPFNACHMTLMHHATVATQTLVGLGCETHAHIIITTALETAQTSPYLLDQLLALSALHLSSSTTITSNSDTAKTFRQEATALQNRALTLFQQRRTHDSDHKPAFLFAGLLGIHVLRNTLSDHLHSISAFTSAFVDYVRVHSGARAIISTRWTELLHSDLNPILTMMEAMDENTPIQGSETTGLSRHLQSMTQISGPFADVCLAALKWVQRLVDIEKRQAQGVVDGPISTIQAALAWPLLVSPEYIDALYQHRPEALVVFACYAVILHHHRSYWIFGDSGAILFKLIFAHVGPFWSDALAWPRFVIVEDGGLSSAGQPH